MESQPQNPESGIIVKTFTHALPDRDDWELLVIKANVVNLFGHFDHK